MSDPKATGGSGSGSKSRTGCSECKRKRVKCDEGKPNCGRCKRYPERCSYELKLSWTQGRPFKKPRTKEPWVTSLDVGVETAGSDVVESASNEVETADKATSTIEPQLSLPEVSQVPDTFLSSGEHFQSTIPLSQCSYHATALQPFNDSTGFDDYQDPFVLSEENPSTDTNLLPVPSDFDFEQADETIERDVSLIPYQHYSPPSKYIHRRACQNVLTCTSSTTILEPIPSTLSIGKSECLLFSSSLYHPYISHPISTYGAINTSGSLDSRSSNTTFAFSSSGTILRSSTASTRK